MQQEIITEPVLNRKQMTRLTIKQGVGTIIRMREYTGILSRASIESLVGRTFADKSGNKRLFTRVSNLWRTEGHRRSYWSGYVHWKRPDGDKETSMSTLTLEKWMASAVEVVANPSPSEYFAVVEEHVIVFEKSETEFAPLTVNGAVIVDEWFASHNDALNAGQERLAFLKKTYG